MFALVPGCSAAGFNSSILSGYSGITAGEDGLVSGWTFMGASAGDLGVSVALFAVAAGVESAGVLTGAAAG